MTKEELNEKIKLLITDYFSDKECETVSESYTHMFNGTMLEVSYDFSKSNYSIKL